MQNPVKIGYVSPKRKLIWSNPSIFRGELLLFSGSRGVPGPWDWLCPLQPCGSPGLKSEHRSSRQLVSDAISALERTGSKARSFCVEFTGQWFWRSRFWFPLKRAWFGAGFLNQTFSSNLVTNSIFQFKWSFAFLKGFVSLIFLRGFYRRNDLRLRFPSGEVQPG